MRGQDRGPSIGQRSEVIYPLIKFQVFARVLNENFLLPFDYARIKKILSDVFSLKVVESNEVLYLKRKAKVVAQRHRNSFTELYLSNMVHLLADDNARALEKYRRDPLANPLIFMPGIIVSRIAIS